MSVSPGIKRTTIPVIAMQAFEAAMLYGKERRQYREETIYQDDALKVSMTGCAFDLTDLYMLEAILAAGDGEEIFLSNETLAQEVRLTGHDIAEDAIEESLQNLISNVFHVEPLGENDDAYLIGRMVNEARRPENGSGWFIQPSCKMVERLRHTKQTT